MALPLRMAARVCSLCQLARARRWDAATGTLLATCQGHQSGVKSAAFSPDGSRLVTASPDGTVRQWDARTGQEVEPPYDSHSSDLYAAVYSPDADWVASAGEDRTIRVWRARGQQDVAVLNGHTASVVDLAFAPDGRRLASLSCQLGRSGPLQPLKARSAMPACKGLRIAQGTALRTARPKVKKHKIVARLVSWPAAQCTEVLAFARYKRLHTPPYDIERP
jgi:hypothetical protein